MAAPQVDVPPPPARWRRWIPSWLRRLIWLDDVVAYDAFLSYSWAADREIAEVIHKVLQRFLCPWYKTRAKTIFRDLSCLPAGSSLEDELRQRLNRSTHLIVLACPEAARSAGMEFEARAWYEKERPGEVVIVVTKGVYRSWSDVRDRALPAALRETMTKEPLWISVDHRREALLERPFREQQRGQLIEDLRQLVLRLYSGRSWEELRGEERSQRSTVLTLLGATVVFFLLLTMFAAWQAVRARQQQHVAESRALAAQAELVLTEDQSQALNLATMAWETSRTPEARLAVAHSFPTLSTTIRGRVAAFSPDSRRIATGTKDGHAWIGNAADGRLVAELKGHTAEIEQLVFSPDGQWIVTASDDRTGRVWKAANGEPVVTLRGHAGGVYSAAFSPDGKWAATGGEDGSILLWSVVDRRPPTIVIGHEKSVNRLEFSPDSKRIITASSDGTARLWSTGDLRLVATLPGHTDDVWDARFSPDGTRIVTASSDKSARLWNGEDGHFLLDLKGHAASVVRADFIPGSQRVVTASRDGTARVWASTGAPLMTLEASGAIDRDKRVVNEISVSPNGEWIVTATEDNTARVWSAATGKVLAVLAGHNKGISHVVFSPDSDQIVTAGDDETVRIWNTTTPRVQVALGDQVCSYGAFSPDSQRILINGCRVGSARILSASTGQVQVLFQNHDSYSGTPAWSPDGKRMLTDQSVWDASTGQRLCRLMGHTSTIFDAEFSPDGRQVVTASRDKTARVWDSNTGQTIAILPHEDRVNSASFSPDGQSVVTAGRNGLAIVWNAATGRRLQTMTGHVEPLRNASFAPDGKHIITGGYDQKAIVWSVASGESLVTLSGHTGSVNFAAFSPDGRRILTAGDREARLWRADDYRLLATLDGSRGGGVAVDGFSRDGKRILITVHSYATNIYSAESGALITTIDGQRHNVMYSALSPDGNHVVTLNRDHTAFLHQLLSLATLTDVLKN